MTKRLGLIGCGNLGYPLACYIAQLGFDELYLHDLDHQKVIGLKSDLASVCPSLQVKDNINTGDLDVVVLSLSGSATIAFVTDERNHTLFKSRRVFVSLGRPNYDDAAAHQNLDSYLVKHGISLLFGFGLEPGLVEVLMQHLATMYVGELTSLSAVCGGVPQHPNPPLYYDLLFGDRLPALNRRALFNLDGKLSSCRRFDVKESRFVEGIGVLDVYHDGLSPYLLSSLPVRAIPNVKQQTARWPGFVDCMRILLSLGLLDEQEMPSGNATPSDVTHAILRRNGNLLSNRPDISFVEVVAHLTSGEQVRVSVVATFDERDKLTGMAQLTSFTAAWAALQVVNRADPSPLGLILSHEFFDENSTNELLNALQRHTKCTVMTTHV